MRIEFVSESGSRKLGREQVKLTRLGRRCLHTGFFGISFILNPILERQRVLLQDPTLRGRVVGLAHGLVHGLVAEFITPKSVK